MRRTLLVIATLIIIEAYTLVPAPIHAPIATARPIQTVVTPIVPPKVTRTATLKVTPEVVTRTATPIVTPTATRTVTPTPTFFCTTAIARLISSASAESLNVSDTVTIRATLTNANESCLSLGQPQYRLYTHLYGLESIFSPDQPAPVAHYLGVAPGKSDSVEFTLTAIASGQATLTAGVSFEVHIGYPGPAYWGYASATPLIITVAP
jgi:hypothetical protein